MKKKTIFLLLQYVVFFGLGFALIYHQYTSLTPQDFADLRMSLSQVSDRAWILIPIIIIGFLSHLFRALRWQIMLEPLSIFPSLFNTVGAVFIGYATNLAVPRMGEVAKCTVIARYEKVPADKVIGTIVAERAFDLVCLMIITVLTFLVQMDIIGGYVQELLSALDGKHLLIMAIVAVVALIGFVWLMKMLYEKTKNGKVGGFIKGLAEGLKAIFAMKKRALFILYTVLLWGAYLSLIYIGFSAIPATEHLGIGAALSILVFGSLGMIVTPGGLGAYPKAIQVVLAKVYAIKDSFGLAFGWLSWLAQTIIIILFAIVFFLILPIYNKRKDEQISLDKG